MKKKKIGRIDKADFPEFQLKDINVKIDTGTYNSSIHCSDINEIVKNGKKIIRFKLLDNEHEGVYFDELFIDNYLLKEIKSSNGISEMRFVVDSEIILFGKKYLTSFSLTDRSDMKYPILLGRKLLANNFLVDVTKTDLSYKKKIKQNNTILDK